MAIFDVYETYSVVRITDRTLGLCYRLLILAVVLYTATNIFQHKGYMEYETPDGAIEMHLIPLPQLQAQLPGEELLGGQFPRRTSDLYCPLETVGNRGCAVLDGDEILVRSGRDAVLITTFVEEVLQRRSCSQKFVKLPQAVVSTGGHAGTEGETRRKKKIGKVLKRKPESFGCSDHEDRIDN